MIPEIPIPLVHPRTEVRHQILVLEKGQVSPLLLEASDEVTNYKGESVPYPDGILEILSNPNPHPGTPWLDVWQDGSTAEGEHTRMGRRVFARNVVTITQVFLFPLEENMVQS